MVKPMLCASHINILFEWSIHIALLVLVLSGCGVYSNELKDKKFSLIRELTLGVNVLWTGRYLNSTGKKYRPYFCASLGFIAFFIVYTKFICP